MFEIFGFYKFTKIKLLKKNKAVFQDYLSKKNIRGTIIISREGLNGTISGKANAMESALKPVKVPISSTLLMLEIFIIKCKK